MPRRLLTPCLVSGCPQLGERGRCAEHAPAAKRERNRAYDHTRGSAASRGYGPTWRRLRLMHLRREPLCRECRAPATDVDHVIPLARGGASHEDNLQSLCHSCHAQKTNREDGGGWRAR